LIYATAVLFALVVLIAYDASRRPERFDED
jgi:hypothetical protein